jgi:hypothetical protein
LPENRVDIRKKIARSEAFRGSTPIVAIDFEDRFAGFPKWSKDLRRLAVNELGAELDWSVAARDVARVDSATDPLPRLLNENRKASLA